MINANKVIKIIQKNKRADLSELILKVNRYFIWN